MALQIIGLIIAVYIVALLNVRYILLILMRLVRSDHVVVWLLSLIFLPGTLIHELSHLLCAELLLVPTSDLHIIPQLLPDRTVKLGSVHMVRTDAIRRFIIGTAPMTIGLLLIGSGTFLVSTYFSASYAAWGIYLYVLFQVNHSMFSSRKDLEGAIWGILGIALIVILVQFLSTVIVAPTINQLIATAGTHISVAAVYLRNGLLYGLLLDVGFLVCIWVCTRVVRGR